MTKNNQGVNNKNNNKNSKKDLSQRRNQSCNYDEAVSWCHKIIQTKDSVLFDPQDFHDGVTRAAKRFGYTFEV